MALFKYLRREGPVCECGALSKETEQVHKCVRPIETYSKNAKADQKHGTSESSVLVISCLQLRCSPAVGFQIPL